MDCDKLISLVRDKPTLWDRGNSLFKDRTVREKCWLEVGQGMRDDWDDLSMMEKKNELTEIKNKWRHIRDHFVRSLNGGKSGDSATKKRKYVYADSLEFLKTSLEKIRTSGNVGEFLDVEETHDSCPLSSQSPLTPSNATPDDHMENPVITSTTRTKKSPATSTPFQSIILKAMETSESHDHNDPDKAYLFSLLPFYKSLTITQKLKFQQTCTNFMLAIQEAEQPTFHPNIPNFSRYSSGRPESYPYSQPPYTQLFPSLPAQPTKPFLPYSVTTSQTTSRQFQYSPTQYPT